MATVDVERVASEHLYEDERILFTAEQPIRRKMPLRLLAALPGVLVVAAVAVTLHGLVESDPLVLTGEHGRALTGTLAALATAGAAWIWRVAYRPLRAYRGVRRLHAVLTDRRFLWIEELGDGSTRVRHPFRTPMLRVGDVRALAIRERRGGGGDVALRGPSSSDLARIRVSGPRPSARDVAALVADVLRVPPPRRARAAPRGSGRVRLPGGRAPS